MLVLGLDGAGKGCSGLAVAEFGVSKKTDKGLDIPLLCGMYAVLPAKDVNKTFKERFVPVFEQYDLSNSVVYVEMVPKKVAKKVKNSEARIGYHVGYVSGLVSAKVILEGGSSHFVEVGDWRDTMILTANREGLGFRKPTRKGVAASLASVISGYKNFERIRVEGREKIRVNFNNCDHSVCYDADIFLSLSHRPTRCPTCFGRSTPPVNEVARAVTSAWKKLACDFIKHLYPVEYSQLVADSRSRARKKDQPDHELRGVSDACEATCIMLHGWFSRS